VSLSSVCRDEGSTTSGGASAKSKATAKAVQVAGAKVAQSVAGEHYMHPGKVYAREKKLVKTMVEDHNGERTPTLA
jgi:hypothetical protein